MQLRAVGFGLAVTVLLTFFGSLAPVAGHAAAGAAGGIAAGTLGASTAREGRQYGLAVGIPGAAFGAALTGLVAAVVGLETTVLWPLASLVPGGVAGVAVVVLGGAVATVAGAAGGGDLGGRIGATVRY